MAAFALPEGLLDGRVQSALYLLYAGGDHVRPPDSLLHDHEIITLVRVAASLGVDKIRLTGGEPTVRRGLVDLVRAIRGISGIRRVAMTTTGCAWWSWLGPLVEAGLDQVNVSIDSLNPERFKQITRRGALDEVWRGIAAAEAAGLRLKLNCVVTRGFNDDEVVELARLTLGNPWEVRFIELMPLGSVSTSSGARWCHRLRRGRELRRSSDHWRSCPDTTARSGASLSSGERRGTDRFY